MSFSSFAGSVVAKVFARVRGLTVVIVCTFAAFILFASFALPTWEKIVGYSVFALCLGAEIFKLIVGGDESPIMLRISDDGITMDNIPPLTSREVLSAALQGYLKRPRQLPQHAGLIEGSAGDQASLKKGADVPESLEIPPDAASLQPSAADTASVGLREGKPKIEKIDR